MASDLGRLYAPIHTALSGGRITEAQIEHLAGHQANRVVDLRALFRGEVEMPPMAAWPSKNWGWIIALALLLWARQTGNARAEAIALRWIRRTLEEQLNDRFMDGEQDSRIYLVHMLLTIMGIERIAPEVAVLCRRWIEAAHLRMALMAVPAPQVNSWGNRGTVPNSYACGMAGARSLSDPPGHLDHWNGGRMLWAALNGGNPFDRGSTDWLLWGEGPRLADEIKHACRSVMAGDHPDMRMFSRLPGTIAPVEIARFGRGVLVVCLDNSGLSYGSTDSIAASWTGIDGRQKWLSPDDAERQNGAGFVCDVDASGERVASVYCYSDRLPSGGLWDAADASRNLCELHVDSPGALRYRLRIHRGARLLEADADHDPPHDEHEEPPMNNDDSGQDSTDTGPVLPRPSLPEAEWLRQIGEAATVFAHQSHDRDFAIARLRDVAGAANAALAGRTPPNWP